MDRQDRRQFKLNLKHEKRYEEEKKKEMEANRNMAESLGADGKIICIQANPQIFHAINYLANYFVRFLPGAICAVCRNSLMTDLR